MQDTRGERASQQDTIFFFFFERVLLKSIMKFAEEGESIKQLYSNVTHRSPTLPAASFPRISASLRSRFNYDTEHCARWNRPSQTAEPALGALKPVEFTSRSRVNLMALGEGASRLGDCRRSPNDQLGIENARARKRDSREKELMNDRRASS